MGWSKIFMGPAGSFRLLPATSKSQNTLFFFAKNGTFWCNSRQFFFRNILSLTVRNGFINLQNQVFAHMEGKKIIKEPVPFRPLSATSKVTISHSSWLIFQPIFKISKFCRATNFCRTETLIIWKSIYFSWRIRCDKN